MRWKFRRGTEGTVCLTLLRLELQLEDLTPGSWNLLKDLFFPCSPSMWHGPPQDMGWREPWQVCEELEPCGDLYVIFQAERQRCV